MINTLGFTIYVSYLIFSRSLTYIVNPSVFITNKKAMPKRSKNIAGRTYGELKAFRFKFTHQGQHYWECVCSCSRIVIKRKSLLIHGPYPICGNFHYSIPPTKDSANKKRPGDSIRKNATIRKAYNAWSSAKQRCYNPENPYYKYYSGIGMCPDWKNSFDTFLSAMGKPVPGQTLGRIDPDKGFEKGNCMWATCAYIKEIHSLLK